MNQLTVIQSMDLTWKMDTCFFVLLFLLVANPCYYGKGGKGAPIWEIEWGMIFWHLIRFDTRRKINGSNK